MTMINSNAAEDEKVTSLSGLVTMFQQKIVDSKIPILN